jgi:hypothetical protein
LAGAVEGVIAGWFDLLIIFPMGIGLAAGFGAARMVESSKVRAPALAALLAALGGLVGQGIKQEVEYQRFLRSDLLASLQEPGQPLPDMDQVLLALTGKTGRAGYLVDAGRAGHDHQPARQRGPHPQGPGVLGVVRPRVPAGWGDGLRHRLEPRQRALLRTVQEVVRRRHAPRHRCR